MSGKLSKAQGFKKSRTGMYISMGSSLFGAYGTIKRGRLAKAEGDRLQLVDVAVSAAGIVTGILLLVRELRRVDSVDDILKDL